MRYKVNKKFLVAIMSLAIMIPVTVDAVAAGKVRYTAGVAAVVASADEGVEASVAEEEAHTDASETEASETESTDAANDTEEFDLGAGAGSDKSIVEIAKKVEELANAEKDAIAGYENLGIAKVADNLNIREEAKEDGKLVGKMRKNAACEILEIDGEWAHIKSGGVNGYVKSEFLLTGDEAKARAEEVKTITAKVTTTTLYVREEANTDSRILTLVPMDEELEIVEGADGDEWIKVVIDTDEGWVNTDFIEFKENLEKAISVQELKYGEGVSDVRVSLVNYSKQFLGNPYVWGGTSLTKGADCSGYVQSIFRKYGISLPRTSVMQSQCGKKISASEAKPGDLFFYAKYGRVNHVAIYIGGGQVINASNPKSGIKIANAYYRTPVAVRRVIND